MGFKKSDLTTSVISEEKISNEITEKESEENVVNVTENMSSMTDSIEVCIIYLLKDTCEIAIGFS